jgi:hypothetical protein
MSNIMQWAALRSFEQCVSRLCVSPTYRDPLFTDRTTECCAVACVNTSTSFADSFEWLRGFIICSHTQHNGTFGCPLRRWKRDWIFTYKAKAAPLHATDALWVERRSSSYSSTSALDGGEWSASRPGRALSPGKGPPVPTVQEAGWVPEPVCTQRLGVKSFASAGDRTSVARSSSP